MGRAQDLFDSAVKSYDQAISMIRDMDEVYQAAMNQADPSRKGYDTKITLAQFDWILQAILLNAALSDGNFDRLEQQFVDKITDYGDLMAYIRKKTNGQLDLSWAAIAGVDRGTQQKLMDLLPDIMNETCDSFVGPLAAVDNAVDSVDFLDRLTRLIGEIAYYLSAVDGTVETLEANACGDMAHTLFMARWNRLKR